MGNKFSKTMKIFSTKSKKLFSSKSCTLCLLVVLMIGVLLYFYSNNLRESFVNDDKDFGTGKKLVLFYADWCGHCKSIHSDWDKAAKKSKNKKIQMAKVNCGDESEEHSKIVKKYGVSGYPTIKLLNNGKVEEDYEGGRSEKDFLSYINSH